MRTGASSDSNASSWMMRGEALADAAGARVLVHDEDAAAVARAGEHRLAIERRERSQVEHARLDAVGGEPLGDTQRGVHVGAVRDDREIVRRRAGAPRGRSESAAGASAARTCLMRGSR